ncbi:MAG: hypothetical protein OQK98_16050 [Gammaproteobacteria bacterium]|nr:hypothetical protein [Gammaproteobacteria bacterium]
MGDNKSSGQFQFPGGIAVILLALGVFIIADNPFQPSRPDVPNKPLNSTENVRARLWQDPFEAVEHYKNAPQHNSATDGFDELISQLQQNKNHDKQNVSYSYDLHVIAVMVTGGPYAENKETRIRSRYAVSTGLLSAGYIPFDSEHISYVESTKFTDEYNWPGIIPHELFNLADSEKNSGEQRFSANALVLWLDDGAISRNKPLNMLAELKDLFILNQQQIDNKDNKLKIKFDIIGPAGSTTLTKMYRNINCNTPDNNCNLPLDKYGDENNKIRVFSPRATLDDEAIRQTLNTTANNQKNKPEIKLNFPGLHRTIATDSMLVDNLLCEMLRRGINPFHEKKFVETYNNDNPLKIGNTKCTNYSLKSLNKMGKKDYVVLIGEWDTSYSRNFKTLFKEKISTVVKKANEPSNTENIDINKAIEYTTQNIDWLYSFFYLRGLDGEISKNNNSDDTKTKSKSSSDSKNSKKSFRRAAGANQFDYLRRLGVQISDLEKKYIDKGTIRAIGIVGSDTYDKLLILQALRYRFPDVLFFTTDLDARMLHQDENKYTRNLVVASAFGLTPENKNHHYHGLAFRDSYQTALYNSIQQSLNSPMDDLYSKCTKFYNTENSRDCVSPVKIFEIGNNTAVDYSHENNTYDRFPEKILESGDINNKVTLYISIFISLFVLLFLLTSNVTRIYTSVIFFIIAYVSIWLYTYDLSANKEFHAIFTGTSVWPAYIIRMVASITAIILIIYAIINLKTNTIDIITDNELSTKHCIRFIDTLREVIIQPGTNFFKKIVLQIIAALKWLFCYNYYDTKTSKSKINPGYFTCIFISSWGCKDKKHDEKHLSDLFYQYLYLSKPVPRFIRVFFISVFYFIVTYTIIFSFPSTPVTPFVGEVNANTSFKILLSVLVPYVLLIFLISDITRLNARFVFLMTKYNIIWPENILDRYCKKYGLSKEISTEKLKIDLVVKRSKVVDKLICFPFIILTLMILSRSSVFDRWHTSPQLAFVILLGLIIALSSAIRLRNSAKMIRYYALKNLNDIYKTLLYKEANPDKFLNNKTTLCNSRMSESVKNLIEEIRNIKTGPFTPLAQHPIISAIALPFGGVGGLYIIDALSKINI